MKSAAELRQAADRYRRLATRLTDKQTVKALKELAEEYEAAADAVIKHYGTTDDPKKA